MKFVKPIYPGSVVAIETEFSGRFEWPNGVSTKQVQEFLENPYQIYEVPGIEVYKPPQNEREYR